MSIHKEISVKNLFGYKLKKLISLINDVVEVLTIVNIFDTVLGVTNEVIFVLTIVNDLLINLTTDAIDVLAVVVNVRTAL